LCGLCSAGCSVEVDHAEAGAVFFAKAAFPGGLDEFGRAGEGEGGEGADDVDLFEGDLLGADVGVAVQVGGVEGQGEAVVGGEFSGVEQTVFVQQVVADGLGEGFAFAGTQVVGAAIRQWQGGDDRRHTGEGGRGSEGRLRQDADFADDQAQRADLDGRSGGEQTGRAVEKEVLAGRTQEPFHPSRRNLKSIPDNAPPALRHAQAGEDKQLESLAASLFRGVAVVVQIFRVVRVRCAQQAIYQPGQQVLMVQRQQSPPFQFKAYGKSHSPAPLSRSARFGVKFRLLCSVYPIVAGQSAVRLHSGIEANYFL